MIEKWNEKVPQDNALLQLGADEIRTNKRAIRERFAVEHFAYSDETDHDDVGKHKNNILSTNNFKVDSITGNILAPNSVSSKHLSTDVAPSLVFSVIRFQELNSIPINVPNKFQLFVKSDELYIMNPNGTYLSLKQFVSDEPTDTEYPYTFGRLVFYPSPCRFATAVDNVAKVSLEINKAALFTLSIYNNINERVRTVCTRALYTPKSGAANLYVRIDWNGLNDDGNRVSEGAVYHAVINVYDPKTNNQIYFENTNVISIDWD